MGLSDDSEQLTDGAAIAATVESNDDNPQLQREHTNEKLGDAEEETKEADLPDAVQPQFQQQHEQQFESDAALAAAMSFGCEAEDPVFLSCQICFDVLLEHETVTGLCGDACTLEACAECLVQHLTASVYSFYPGVLPKVRCPTCFTLLNKSAWEKFVKPELEEKVVAAVVAGEQQAPTASEPAPVETTSEIAPAAAVEEGAQTGDESAAATENETADANSLEQEADESAVATTESVVDSAATATAVSTDEVVAESPVEQILSALETDATASENVATDAEGVSADASNEAETVDAAQQQQEGGATTSPAPQDSVPPATTATAPNAAQKLDFSHVLEKYEILCRQSCEFQSPCCHNPEYTMLPPFSGDAESKLAEVVQAQEEDPLPALKEHLELFCFHREETKTFYDLLSSLFSADTAESALWRVLAMIRDEERRATLLLYHLFLHPDTYTLCCDEIVCFKCKAHVHHDGQCNDFIEDDCVLQCRGCHVTLVKVDGCDSVSCVCGHSIHWPSEMEKQRSQRKQLAPEDDGEHAQWLKWKQTVGRSHAKISSLAQSLREVRLNRLIRRNRAALLEMLARYRSAKAEAEAKRMQQQLELEQEAQMRASDALGSVPEEAAESEVAEPTAGEQAEESSESLAPPLQQEVKRLEGGELHDEIPTPLPAAA